ncbi:hypothetical protein FSB64_39825, partial [Paraburkholderia sp. JPY454]|nr:hypothetical protein [Paraburkholderia youngii]
RGCMRAHAPRGSRGKPVIQREIARASLLNVASVVMTGRFSTAVRCGGFLTNPGQPSICIRAQMTCVFP